MIAQTVGEFCETFPMISQRQMGKSNNRVTVMMRLLVVCVVLCSILKCSDLE